ncbi:g7196 [Coccomyxa elongata]
MIAYGEFRSGYSGDREDTRLVFYGLRYILETYLLRQWTLEDVEKSEKFYRTHMAPGRTAFPFPKDLFVRFIEKHDGYFPIKLEALPEGTCVNAHVPVYQITSTGEFAPLCTYLETLLTMVWYPSTVATLSRRARDVLEAAFEQSVDGGAASPLLPSRLHDFGFRGCCTVEQSVLGGTAHLLSFDGTDTLSAAYYAQFELNDGEPIGLSIPATEHSVMTSWPSERDAILNMISHFGDGIFACVMDSYDYAKALSEVVPSIAEAKVGAGGYMVLRPDSGDPVETVLAGLEAAEKVFGVDVNKKGYKVPRGCGVIQGDGINLHKLSAILAAVLQKGFSAETVAFGMGGGLLQKVNRDTLSFATKLSHVVYADGTPADIMKNPVSDAAKISFPGALAVKRVHGIPTVFPAEGGHVSPEENMLRVVYDHGPVQNDWKSFAKLRQQVAEEWTALPKAANVVSKPLADKVETTRHKKHV